MLILTAWSENIADSVQTYLVMVVGEFNLPIVPEW